MKLFVTDYDDTLYTNDEEIKINIQKLKLLQKKNFLIMIATGRSINSIKTQIKLHKIPYDYLSCSDGSIVYDRKNNIIWKEYMNTEILKDLINFYQKLNYEEIQFSYPFGYLNTLKEENTLLGINICIDSNLINEKIINNFMKLKKKYPNYNFLNYRHTHFSYLCVKPKDVSKSFSISMLIRKLNINKEDVYIIGDSSNDVEMLRDFQGVRMTNSSLEIEKIIKTHYSSVSDYIDDIIKNEKMIK